VLKWYAAEGKSWPWRTSQPDQYVILVSEFMLQQTQAARVAEKLPIFLKLFPTMQKLAHAKSDSVIRAWQGMGYNSRALRLHETAQIIQEKYGGVVPSESAALKELPGIGPYASNSLVSFIYNLPNVVLDVNVRRVYSRIASPQTETQGKLSDSTLHEIGVTIIPQLNGAIWHHAIMDLGASVCTARNPRCASCPLIKKCPSALNMRTKLPNTQTTKRPEPSFNGTPNRLWRGKVVEVLRYSNPTGITTTALYKKAITTKPPTKTDKEWFQNLLLKLERDRLITVRKNLITL